MLVARSGGRTNPSVNSDEPLISNARSKPRTPRAWNIAVNATSTSSIHTNGSTSEADRRVERHHPVAALVGAVQPGEQVEHLAQADEDDAGDERRRRPAGSTNVRTAESMTSTSEHDAAGEPQDLHDARPSAGQLRRLVATRGPVGAAGGRCLRADWRRLASSRARLAAVVGLVARRGRSIRKPVGERARAAARGRSRGCGPASASRTRSPATTGPSRSSRRARWRGPSDGDVVDVEPHLDARVRRVGVLAARAARTARAPLELVERDHAARASPAALPSTQLTVSSRLGRWVRLLTSNRVPTERGAARGAYRCTFEARPSARRAGIARRRDRRRRRTAAPRCSWPAPARRPARRPAAAAPKAGGEITYGLEAETGGGWCLHVGAPRDLRASWSAPRSTTRSRCRTPRTRWCRTSPKSVEPNADYTEWTIKLRDGIKFHDGTPLDADAVVAERRRLAQGHAHRRRIYKDVTDVTATDPLDGHRHHRPSVGRVRRGTSTSTAGSGSWRPPSSTIPRLRRAT